MSYQYKSKYIYCSIFRRLFTYCITSIQLAFCLSFLEGGIVTSIFKFLGVFAPTQLPLAVIEGILTVIIMIILQTYALPEMKLIGFGKRGVII